MRTILKYRARRDFVDISYLGPRVLDKIVLALIIMSLYWKVGANKAQSNVNNLTAVLFLWAIMPGYASSAYTPSLVLERTLFIRERNDGLYRPVTYVAAKLVEELAVASLNTLACAAIVFFPCQLAGSFVYFWAVYFLTTATGIALGYLISSAAPNMDVANAALPAYVTTLLFFVGLLLRVQDQVRGKREKSCVFLFFFFFAPPPQADTTPPLLFFLSFSPNTGAGTPSWTSSSTRGKA